MSDPQNSATTVPPPKRPKDRSPSFPFIPLGTAIERLVAFDGHFGRHPTPADKAGLAWGYKEKSSQADQTLGALRSFGLVLYKGTGPKREITVSSEGRTYLRAEQGSTREGIVKSAALRPRMFRKLWLDWREDRPVDAVALEKLKFAYKFSDTGAPAFLKVYDATVAYAKLSKADKIPNEVEAADDGDFDAPGDNDDPPPPPPPRNRREVKIGMKEDVFTLKEGDAVFQWPEQLSQESFDDLEAWTKLILRKVQRSVIKENDGASEGTQ